MNINSETEVSVDLQIGPTSLGMVRLFFSTKGTEIPMDFSPDEADEIAEERGGTKSAFRETLVFKSYKYFVPAGPTFSCTSALRSALGPP